MSKENIQSLWESLLVATICYLGAEYVFTGIMQTVCWAFYYITTFIIVFTLIPVLLARLVYFKRKHFP